MVEKMLAESEQYLKTGSHIGTRFKHGHMRRYIFKKRPDQLNVLDVETIDSRIRIAAKFLADYASSGIVIVSRKLYGQTPAKKFAEAIGALAITNRFVPGTFTNPSGKKFIEPKILIVTEPETDFQSIKEAVRIRIPVIALASTNNTLSNIDLVIPVNNKGRKSLALVLWLLAREILKEKGEIKSSEEFKETAEDFEHQIQEGEREERQDSEKRFSRRDDGDRDRRRSYR